MPQIISPIKGTSLRTFKCWQNLQTQSKRQIYMREMSVNCWNNHPPPRLQAMASSTLLRALADPKDISIGKIVHCKVIVCSLLPDAITSNHLMDMYGKFGLLDDARCVFDHMPTRNVVSWSILISVYSKIGCVKEAIHCFRLMISGGFEPNDFTYVSVLSACARLRVVKVSKEIHGRVYRFENVVSSNFVSNSLMNSYLKCGLISSARTVFEEILQPNLVSWCSIISGHSQAGKHEEALKIFFRARKLGVVLNEFVLASVLKACAGLEKSMVAKQVHCLSLKSGLFSDSFVEAGTIDAFVNSYDLESAFLAFSDAEEPELASWSAIIKGNALDGHGEKAMYFFSKLLSTGLRPNEHVLTSILVGCSISHIIKGGMQIHCFIIKLGYQLSLFVCNTVLDFYAKCGMLRESLRVFDAMEERNVVSWNAILASFIRHGNLIGASKLLNEMLVQFKELNFCTYVSILSFCADLPAVGSGLSTHCCIIKLGFDSNVVVGSALINMYAKCGLLNYARRVFDRVPTKNLVFWNSLIGCYALHGFGMEALEMFHRMEEDGTLPNEITYMEAISACAHAGLVEQGEILFKLMKENGVCPRIEHYACMVDLFARAGHTKRAYNFIKSMPLEPNNVIWRCLLAGCNAHGDLNTGNLAFKYILLDDPHDNSARAMASALFARVELWEEKTQVRNTVKKKVMAVPGRSWTETNGRFLLLKSS